MGGFSPQTLRAVNANPWNLRSRSFMTFAESPGQLRSNALGRRGPIASWPSRRSDHLQPTMLLTGTSKARVAEAKQLGVQSVPALVLGKQVFHVNFGAKLRDLG